MEVTESAKPPSPARPRLLYQVAHLKSLLRCLKLRHTQHFWDYKLPSFSFDLLQSHRSSQWMAIRYFPGPQTKKSPVIPIFNSYLSFIPHIQFVRKFCCLLKILIYSKSDHFSWLHCYHPNVSDHHAKPRDYAKISPGSPCLCPCPSLLYFHHSSQSEPLKSEVSPHHFCAENPTLDSQFPPERKRNSPQGVPGPPPSLTVARSSGPARPASRPPGRPPAAPPISRWELSSPRYCPSHIPFRSSLRSHCRCHWGVRKNTRRQLRLDLRYARSSIFGDVPNTALERDWVNSSLFIETHISLGVLLFGFCFYLMWPPHVGSALTQYFFLSLSSQTPDSSHLLRLSFLSSWHSVSPNKLCNFTETSRLLSVSLLWEIVSMWTDSAWFILWLQNFVFQHISFSLFWGVRSFSMKTSRET